MVDPPDYGNPPQGPGPRYGQGGQQPPPGPPPGGQGQPYPPPGGPPPGGTQPYPQYQQGAAGQGPPPQPPGYPYRFGGDAPPPKPRRTGLIIGIVAACVVLLAAIGLIAFTLLGDDDDDDPVADDTSEEATSESEPEETTGPPTVDEAVGLCLPYEPAVEGFSFDLTTPCDDATAAFWTITAASDEVEGTVDGEGQLTDPAEATAVCGDDYASFTPGEAWKSWFFTYDDTTGTVEELHCVEAIGNPDAEGRLPYTPDTGDCFDDSDQWWSVECDSDLALYEVVDTVAVDPPEQMDESAASEASEACSGGAYYWQLLDVEGRTATILCGDDA